MPLKTIKLGTGWDTKLFLTILDGAVEYTNNISVER